MKTKSEMITALIASDRSPFDKSDEATLKALSDEKLAVLVEATEDEPDEVETLREKLAAATQRAEDVLKAASAKKSPEAWLEEAPAEVRALVDGAKRAQEQTKAASIKALVAALPGAFTEDELKAKTQEQLDDILRAARVTASATIDRALQAGGESRLVAAGGGSEDPEPQADMTTWFKK